MEFHVLAALSQKEESEYLQNKGFLELVWTVWRRERSLAPAGNLSQIP
jgi:hypothetical protein